MWKLQSQYFFQPAVLMFLSVFISCSGPEQEVVIVDFSVDSAQITELQENNHSKIRPLYVAVAAMISPGETFNYYKDLLEYISEKTGRQVSFKQKETYSEVNEMLEKNEVDIAFICSGAYIRICEKIKILAVPVCDSKPYYQAYVITNKATGIKSFSDFKNKSFAFTDPLSNTGCLYATKRALDYESNKDAFFSKVIYTNAHDLSIQMVAKRSVEGASVDGLIFEYLKHNSPEVTEQIRIIEKSELFGIPPIVACDKIDTALENKLRAVFLEIDKDPKGKEIIRRLMIDKFIPAGDTLYRSLRKFEKLVSQ